MDYEKRIGNGTAGSPAQMPVGGVPDNRHSARCRGGENVVDVGIIVVYCISSLLAGLFFSKGAASRRFLWGMAAGVVYFLVICAVTFVVEGQVHLMSSSCITTLFICTGSGMLGGMLG